MGYVIRFLFGFVLGGVCCVGLLLDLWCVFIVLFYFYWFFEGNVGGIFLLYFLLVCVV